MTDVETRNAEILRLIHEGISQSAVAKTVGVTKNIVNGVVVRARREAPETAPRTPVKTDIFDTRPAYSERVRFEDCRRVWASALLVACKDYCRAIQQGQDPRHPDIRYTRERDFTDLCEMAGVEADAVRDVLTNDPEAVSRIADMGRRTGEVAA